jgi:hypothetical protein
MRERLPPGAGRPHGAAKGMIECFPIDILPVFRKMAPHRIWEVGIIS